MIAIRALRITHGCFVTYASCEWMYSNAANVSVCNRLRCGSDAYAEVTINNMVVIVGMWLRYIDSTRRCW